MKRYEALKLVSGTLKMLSDYEVNIDDWRFVPMYEEFRVMRGHGVKYMLDHCQKAIVDYYDVPYVSEDSAWLTGYLMRKVVQQIAAPCK